MVWSKLFIADSQSMQEIDNGTVDLIVTSPPYWSLKDYGHQAQIGYGQTLHQYLKSLYNVFSESYRVLTSGGRLCVNIGDILANVDEKGFRQVIPLHAEILTMCDRIGFNHLGMIIWNKINDPFFLGTYPYPQSGVLMVSYEYVMIFQKPGKFKHVSQEVKESSKLTKSEWYTFFSSVWNVNGTVQRDHPAMFPDEIPRRLIRMYSYVGDVVLDPFVGSGTTMAVANAWGRNAIGYEINPEFVDLIKRKVLKYDNMFINVELEVIKRSDNFVVPLNDYVPSLHDVSSIKSRRKRVSKVRTPMDNLWKGGGLDE